MTTYTRKAFVEASYLGKDGESHVAKPGETVTVHEDDVRHFDWVQRDTPEYRQAERELLAAEAERAEQRQRQAEPSGPDDIPGLLLKGDDGATV